MSDKVSEFDNLSIPWNLLRAIKMRLGEVYVVGQTLLPSTAKQGLQPGNLGWSGAATYEDHDAGVLARGSQREKVVAITGNEDCALSAGIGEDVRIRCGHG